VTRKVIGERFERIRGDSPDGVSIYL